MKFIRLLFVILICGLILGLVRWQQDTSSISSISATATTIAFGLPTFERLDNNKIAVNVCVAVSGIDHFTFRVKVLNRPLNQPAGRFQTIGEISNISCFNQQNQAIWDVSNTSVWIEGTYFIYIEVEDTNPSNHGDELLGNYPISSGTGITYNLER